MARLPNPQQDDAALADRVAEIGDYLRFHGLLDGADRELAILTVAREVEARYEWQAHEPLARSKGAREEAIAAVRARAVSDSLTEREHNVIDVVRALSRENTVPDALFQREVDLPEGAGPTF